MLQVLRRRQPVEPEAYDEAIGRFMARLRALAGRSGADPMPKAPTEDEIELVIEVARVAAALRTAIRLSRVSHREIERRLHMSTGYLTRVLKGEIGLRVQHVLAVLRVIGFPAGSFFGVLFPDTPPEDVEESRVTRGFSVFHADPEPPRNPDEVMEELRGCVRNLMTLLDKEPKR